MEEQKPVVCEKQNLKTIFMVQLEKAFSDLIKQVLNAKNLGIAIIVWCLLSFAASVYRRGWTDCSVTVPLDSYLFGKMLCPIK
jgi:hypothetical protein